MGLTAKRNVKEPGYLPCLKTAFRKLHRSSPPKFSFSNSYLKQIQHRFLGVFDPRHGTPNRCTLSCWLEYSQSLFRWPISIQNALRNQHIGFAHPHPSPHPPLYMRIWILSPLINSRLKNFTFFLTTARPMLQTSAFKTAVFLITSPLSFSHVKTFQPPRKTLMYMDEHHCMKILLVAQAHIAKSSCFEKGCLANRESLCDNVESYYR